MCYNKRRERTANLQQKKPIMSNFTFDDQSATLNLEYGTKSTDREILPVIMAANYEPKIKDIVSLCLLTDKTTGMNEGELKSLNLTPSVVQFGNNEDCQILTGLNQHRFIILAKPDLFVMDKDTKKVLDRLQKGMKLGKIITVAKLYLAILKSDGKLLMDESGLIPQICTLKLTSTKTKLIFDNQDPKASTIVSLNKALQTNFKSSDNLVHLVSISIVAKPTKFTSNDDLKKSSVGIMFQFDGGCRILTEENQKSISALVQSERFIELSSNPFGILGTKEPVNDSDEESNDSDFQQNVDLSLVPY